MIIRKKGDKRYVYYYQYINNDHTGKKFYYKSQSKKSRLMALEKVKAYIKNYKNYDDSTILSFIEFETGK